LTWGRRVRMGVGIKILDSVYPVWVYENRG